MRRVSPASLVLPLILGGALAGCGEPDSAATPELRAVPAANLRLVGTPLPDSRRLTVRYVANALLWEAQPVARVEVDQDSARVVVRLFLNEQVPDADEAVSNVALVRTATVDLEQALGKAAVLDGSATPPVPMPPDEPTNR